MLEEALAKERKEYPDRTYRVHETRILLDYLRSEDVEKRVQHALEYSRTAYWLEDERLKDVGRLLVRDGADSIRCQPLLKPSPNRLRDHWGRSREGESW